MIRHEGLEEYKRDLFQVMKEDKTNRKQKELRKVLIIGPPPEPERLIYLSHHIWKQFNRLGYDVKYFTPKDLKPTLSMRQKHAFYSLTNISRELGDWKPDLIFIEQCLLYIQNTTNIPTMYHQREPIRRHEFYYPTIEYCDSQYLLDMYGNQKEPMWAYEVRMRKVLPVAVDLKVYQYVSKKKYKGLCLIELRESIEASLKRGEYLRRPFLILLGQEIEAARPYMAYTFPPNIDLGYRQLLQECQMLYCYMQENQLVSRRILETMACGTQVILKMQLGQEEALLNDYKFERGVHYVGIDSIDDLADVEYDPKMVKNAHNLVKNNHTYEHRIKEIIKDYYEVC